MEEPGRLQSMGSLRVGHDWATSLSLFTFMHWRRKWQPTPVFLPGESQGRGARWAAVYGVAQNRTRLKRLSSSSSSSNPSMKSIHILLPYPILLFVMNDYVCYIFSLDLFCTIFLILPRAKTNKIDPSPKLQQPWHQCTKHTVTGWKIICLSSSK